MKNEILFKALSSHAIMPKKATEGAIAFDLYAPEDFYVKEGRSIMPLDFSMSMNKGFEFKIEPRSGFSAKGVEGYIATKSNDKGVKKRFDADVIQGKVDSDYRGCVGVIIKNCDVPFIIERGARIAQGTFYYSNPEIHFVEVTELDNTERGEGGFGHTGSV